MLDYLASRGLTSVASSSAGINALTLAALTALTSTHAAGSSGAGVHDPSVAALMVTVKSSAAAAAATTAPQAAGGSGSSGSAMSSGRTPGAYFPPCLAQGPAYV